VASIAAQAYITHQTLRKGLQKSHSAHKAHHGTHARPAALPNENAKPPINKMAKTLERKNDKNF
jgi:hypothetical protein